MIERTSTFICSDSEANTSFSGHRKASTFTPLHLTSHPVKNEHLPLGFTTQALIQHCFFEHANGMNTLTSFFDAAILVSRRLILKVLNV